MKKAKTKIADYLEYLLLVFIFITGSAVVIYFLTWATWGILLGGTRLYNFLMVG